jgi:nucleoside-diphosphate-sugar epimerase
VKILVTGSDGFVGKHFSKKLYEQGHDVYQLDIKNGVDARDFFRHDEEQYDRVIHLAAVVGGRQTIEGSPLSLAVDLSIDAELFSWALRTKPGCITYFSSSAAYPTRLQEKESHFILSEYDINLDQIENPDLTYGWAKLTGEMLAQHARKEGISVHIFRPFSGYGTDQDLDYPFPSFIERAKNGDGKTEDQPFEIWGDGTQVRDFIHIDDVIDGAIAGCEANIEVSNLCTGRAISFNELAQLVCQAQGYEPIIKHLPNKPSGVHWRVGDPTYMESYFKPQISLEEGIKRAFEGL